MSAYLLSPDAYSTFRQLLKYNYFDLNLQYILSKYQSKLINRSLPRNDLFRIEVIANWIVIHMVIANAKNVERMSPDFYRLDRLPININLAEDYFYSGDTNHRWLGEAQINRQLIVKAFDWYLTQVEDTQSQTIVFQLIEEINGKYAIKIVKQMPGAWRIPNCNRRLE
jgi:hypothetical protein